MESIINSKSDEMGNLPKSTNYFLADEIQEKIVIQIHFISFHFIAATERRLDCSDFALVNPRDYLTVDQHFLQLSTLGLQIKIIFHRA